MVFSPDRYRISSLKKASVNWALNFSSSRATKVPSLALTAPMIPTFLRVGACLTIGSLSSLARFAGRSLTGT